MEYNNHKIQDTASLRKAGNTMFKRKKKNCCYDKETQKPVMRVSICTGEKVAGFQDKASGKFTDVMLIRSESDLSQFCREYGVEKEDIGKVW